MARGTVKDPQGHQSEEYDFGYIQRTEGFSYDEKQGKCVSLLWEDDLKAKVIPFLSLKNGVRPTLGEGVTFKSVKAHVILIDDEEVNKIKETLGDGKYLGTIGIADVESFDKESHEMS